MVRQCALEMGVVSPASIHYNVLRQAGCSQATRRERQGAPQSARERRVATHMLRGVVRIICENEDNCAISNISVSHKIFHLPLLSRLIVWKCFRPPLHKQRRCSQFFSCSYGVANP